MIEIPKQLRRATFKFIPLKGKRPIEKDWTRKNYAWDEERIQKHIRDGGNYGVVCGYGNLLVIDLDEPSPKFLRKFEEFFPHIHR